MKRYLILTAVGLAGGCAAADLTQPSLAQDGSCTWVGARRSFDLAWRELSDAQLYTEVRNACGYVFIGFKEANLERGVDEQGLVLTSAETVARMKTLLRDLDVVTAHEYDMPAVAAWIEPSLERVVFLRQHSNVDYLEPIFPGTRW